MKTNERRHEDAKSLYWPYYNMKISSAKKSNDGFDLKVCDYTDSSKVLFYVKSSFLNNERNFLCSCHDVLIEPIDEWSPTNSILFIKNVVKVVIYNIFST